MLANGQKVSSHLTLSEYSKVNQVGVDLSVKKVEWIRRGGKILKDKTELNPERYVEVELTKDNEGRDIWTLAPGVYALTFNEGVSIPADHTGFIVSRSSIYRMGAHINSPIWDPGFTTGENEMGTTMVVHTSIELEQNARVGQFYMVSNEEVTDLYDGQFQGKTNY